MIKEACVIEAVTVYPSYDEEKVAVLTFHIQGETCTFQTIICEHSTPEDVLDSFDLDYVCCAIFDDKLYILDECKEALETNKVTKYKDLHRISRMTKAISKGFQCPYLSIGCRQRREDVGYWDDKTPKYELTDEFNHLATPGANTKMVKLIDYEITNSGVLRTSDGKLELTLGEFDEPEYMHERSKTFWSFSDITVIGYDPCSRKSFGKFVLDLGEEYEDSDNESKSDPKDSTDSDSECSDEGELTIEIITKWAATRWMFISIELDIVEFDERFIIANDTVFDEIKHDVEDKLKTGPCVVLIKAYMVGNDFVAKVLDVDSTGLVVGLKFADEFKIDGKVKEKLQPYDGDPQYRPVFDEMNKLLKIIEAGDDSRYGRICDKKYKAYECFMYYAVEKKISLKNAIEKACGQMNYDAGKVKGIDSMLMFGLSLYANDIQTVRGMIHFIDGF